MSLKRKRKPHRRNATVRRVFILPIFGARIQVIVAEDIMEERRKQEELFGPLENGTRLNAICSRSGGRDFALFFDHCGLTRRTVGHEVFHLTHDICEWVGAKFDHETFALLNGELHQRVDSIVGDNIVPDGEEWNA